MTLERVVGEGEFRARLRRRSARLDADYPETHPDSDIVEFYRDLEGRPVGYVRHFAGKTGYILLDG